MMPNFCYTCLSQDREVKPVENLEVRTTLMEWFNSNYSFKVNMDRFLLCWECYAMIIKSNKFKQKVFEALEIRLTLRKEKSAPLFSLTNLGEQTNENYDAEYVFEETNAEITRPKEVASKRKKEKSKRTESKETKKKKANPEPTLSFEKILNVDNHINESDIKKEITNANKTKNKVVSVEEVIDLTEEPKLSSMPVALAENEIKNEDIDADQAETETHRPSKVKPNVFASCVIEFTRETELEKHINEEEHSGLSSATKGRTCATCANNKRLLNRHEQSPNSSYKCPQCDFGHHKRTSIQFHAVEKDDLRSLPVLAASTTEINPHVEKDDIVEIFTCGTCRDSFEGNSAYRAHVRSVHEELAQHAYCKDCSHQFDSVLAFTRHAKMHNLFDELTPDHASGSPQDTLVKNLKRARHNMLSRTCALCNQDPACKRAALNRLNLRGPRFSVSGNLCSPCLHMLHLKDKPKQYPGKMRLNVHIQEKQADS